MKAYDLIIFDCDGTLVDSETLTSKILSDLFTEVHVPRTTEEIKSRFLGTTLHDIFVYLEGMGALLDQGVFEAEYRKRCAEIFSSSLEAFPGVTQLLETLQVPYCIASNGPLSKMEQTLSITGLQQYLPEDRIFSAYEIGVWKPQPDLFLHACECMGVDPGLALIVEDSISGINGAKNAHIDVWAFNPERKSSLLIDRVPNFTSMYHIQKELSRLGSLI